MNSYWPEDKVLRLLECQKAGWTASRIAAELNVTRNSVIGKCHRLGLHREKEPAKSKETKPVSAKRMKTVVKNTEPVAAPKIATPANVMTETSNDNAAPHMWVFRKDDLCKWPGTDRKTGPIFKCDKTRLFGKPYCNGHWHVSISPRRK